jgi:hypothetical protein
VRSGLGVNRQKQNKFTLLEDLQANLRELFHDLTNGQIPGVRKLAELTLR